VPVESVQDIMQEEYRPGSCTPLYDAMGLAINHLDNVTKKEDPVLVTIITDGMENSSEEFSGKAIKELVSKKRESGWTFAYIGANQDAVEVASEMNIYNALNFDATEEGTKAMGLTLADATMRFFESAADDYDNSDDFFENIFESKKKSKKK
jgi:hypothetical protein